jgi:hypothetical protein
MTSQQIPRTRQPDLRQLRQRYEQAAASSAVQTADGLIVLAGLYVALSPWIVGFAGSAALAVNNLVIGLAVAGLGLGYASAFGRLHGMAWLCPLLGIWVIISHWVISGAVSTAGVVVSNVISGAVVLVLGLVGMALAVRRD